MLKLSELEAAVNEQTGELCSINLHGQEFMWGRGRPSIYQSRKDRTAGGWSHSCITMCPLVGSPEKDAEGEYIIANGKRVPMTQHGINRHIPITVKKEGHNIHTQQNYDGGMIEVKEGKFIQFPNKYALSTYYSTNEETINIDITIKNADLKEMNYSLGFHPAFYTLKEGVIHVGAETFTLDDIFKEKVLLLAENENVYYSGNDRSILVQHDLGNIMVWSPQPGVPLICFEPVTGLPKRIKDGFVGSYDSKLLKPSDTHKYNIKITPRLVGR